jgi:hypothetical protein
MAVDESPADAAVQNARKREVVGLRSELGDALVLTIGKAADPQALLILGPAAEASTLRGIQFLKALIRAHSR